MIEIAAFFTYRLVSKKGANFKHVLIALYAEKRGMTQIQMLLLYLFKYDLCSKRNFNASLITGCEFSTTASE